MARRLGLREGEALVISVTPVARGTVRPSLVGHRRARAGDLGAPALAPAARSRDAARVGAGGSLRLVVALTRSWRWRSHKILVTNERIVVEGGVLATSAQHGQPRRRGRDCASISGSRNDCADEAWWCSRRRGAIMIGKLRHPGALRPPHRRRTSNDQIDPVAFDTVFGYEDPEPFDYEVRPRRWGNHSQFE